MSQSCHTILLIRPDNLSANNSTYCDFRTLDDCLESLCYVYEEHLRRHQEVKGTIIYSLEEMYEFLDSFLEMNCLVQELEGECYVPHTVQWIKEKLFLKLGQQTTKKK